MRKIVLSILAMTIVGALWFAGLSLARWEWNRALFFGLVIVAAEVALLGAWLAGRVAGTTGRRTVDPDPRVLAHLASARPDARRFEWLGPLTTQTNVFITFLVGGGVLVSALAWVLDHLGARTMTPVRERRLAEQLSVIAYPADGLLVDEMSALAHDVPYLDDPQLRKLLRRPGHGR